MTVADVLERAGHPLGSHGRTTCPLHHGGNRQAFSYGETWWVCWASCGKGNAMQLARALQVLKPVAVRGLEGFTEDQLEQRRVTSTLYALQRRRETAKAQALVEWSDLHRDGLIQIDLAAAFRTRHVHPLVFEATAEAIADWFAEGVGKVEASHAALDALGSPCGCDPMPRPSPPHDRPSPAV